MSRAWIVGNGISLKKTPLFLLDQEDTVYGMNLIDLAYGWTTWRPTYYVKHEWEDGERGTLSMIRHAEMGIPCYLNPAMSDRIAQRVKGVWPPPIRPINTHCSHAHSNHKRGHKPERWHLPTLCCYASTVNVAAQIAVLEGHDELIFIGCDLGYERFVLLEDGDPNHFDPMYDERNIFPIEKRNETLIDMHMIIKKECDERGIKTWNATVGGILEVHPRKPMREFFNGAG
jgi:hypothetical protein